MSSLQVTSRTEEDSLPTSDMSTTIQVEQYNPPSTLASFVHSRRVNPFRRASHRLFRGNAPDVKFSSHPFTMSILPSFQACQGK